MSWRDNKKPRGGYSRGGRGYRQNRGYSHQSSSDNHGEEGGHGHNSGYRGGGGYRGRPYKRPQANHSYDGKRTKYEVSKRLKEDDIFVTEFVGTHKRFSGIVKERFGDFHVHEISCDGEICKLTNQDIPLEPQDLRDIQKLKETIPADVMEKLESLKNMDDETTQIEIDVTDMDKDLRRNVHAIAKKTPSIVSETVDRDKRKIIVLAGRNKPSSHKFRGDHREDWSAREGNYCHFLLHKVNMDTMDALNQLAVKLRLKSDNFNYAGTKDRRARTTQWVSLKKVNPTKILGAAMQVRGAHVGNFKFAKDPLRLGLLNGNRFRIALRSVDGSDEEIETAVNSLRDKGFINYYGLQRFGTVAAIPTHDIGKALLQGKWEEAIHLILKPREGEQQRDMIEAREIYQKTKDANAALKLIFRSGKIEAKLLKGLSNSGGNNPQGALDHIPRNARLMYIHSYQSLVWNHIVSRRIKELGLKPVVGDLVYDVADSKEIVETETMDYGMQSNEEKEEKPVKTEEKVDESVKKDDQAADSEELNETKDSEESSVPVEEISEMTVSNDNSESQEDVAKTETPNEILDDRKDQTSLPAVKALAAEDLENYTLADVVMPKPGWKVTYPAYAKPWFDEFLAKDDLTTDLRQKNMKYSLGGGYRKILETPDEVSWRIARYNGYHDDLILCDLDEMRGVEQPKNEPEGKHKALILEFSLNSSTYATMALREILGHDTSAYTQAAQSAANQAQERKEEEAKKMEAAGESAKADETEIKREPAEEAELSATSIKVESDKTETVEEPDKITEIPETRVKLEEVPKTLVNEAKDVMEDKMEVVDAEGNIPPINGGQKMETETANDAATVENNA